MRHPLLPLLLAVLPAPLSAQDAPTTVTIELSSFRFSPNMVHLDHGKPYVLRLVNISDGGHDFMARDFFAAAQVDPTDRGKIRNGRVEVDGGGQVDVRLTTPSPGAYKLRCSHFMHAPFGMTGQIVVR
jgi:uncharacterized cupredoxin-like copper-binding protein